MQSSLWPFQQCGSQVYVMSVQEHKRGLTPTEFTSWTLFGWRTCLVNKLKHATERGGGPAGLFYRVANNSDHSTAGTSPKWPFSRSSRPSHLPGTPAELFDFKLITASWEPATETSASGNKSGCVGECESVLCDWSPIKTEYYEKSVMMKNKDTVTSIMSQGLTKKNKGKKPWMPSKTQQWFQIM